MSLFLYSNQLSLWHKNKRQKIAWEFSRFVVLYEQKHSKLPFLFCFFFSPWTLSRRKKEIVALLGENENVQKKRKSFLLNYNFPFSFSVNSFAFAFIMMINITLALTFLHLVFICFFFSHLSSYYHLHCYHKHIHRLIIKYETLYTQQTNNKQNAKHIYIKIYLFILHFTTLQHYLKNINNKS